MGSKKKKTKSLEENLIVSEATEQNNTENDAPILPSELETIQQLNQVISLLNSKVSSQEDDINRLVLENQSLNSKVQILTLRVGGLLKEKEQLTISVNQLLKR